MMSILYAVKTLEYLELYVFFITITMFSC